MERPGPILGRKPVVSGHQQAHFGQLFCYCKEGVEIFPDGSLRCVFRFGRLKGGFDGEAASRLALGKRAGVPRLLELRCSPVLHKAWSLGKERDEVAEPVDQSYASLEGLDGGWLFYGSEGLDSMFCVHEL